MTRREKLEAAKEALASAHEKMRRSLTKIFPNSSTVTYRWGKGQRTGIVQGSTTTSLLLCNPKTRRSSWVPISRVVWEDEG